MNFDAFIFLWALFPSCFIIVCATKGLNGATEFQLRVVHLHVNKLPLFVFWSKPTHFLSPRSCDSLAFSGLVDIS